MLAAAKTGSAVTWVEQQVLLQYGIDYLLTAHGYIQVLLHLQSSFLPLPQAAFGVVPSCLVSQ